MKNKITIIIILTVGFFNLLKSQRITIGSIPITSVDFPALVNFDSLRLLDILNENCNSCPLACAWDTSQPIATWDRVVLSADSGRVEELHLDSMNLSGVLPPSFSGLTALKFLNISNNPISMETNVFQNLTKLEVLKLNNCNLYDLPDLTNCNNLDSLECYNNHLSFDDLEPIFINNTSLEIASNYAPQHTSIPNKLIDKVYEGSPLKINLELRDKSPNNIYSWYKGITEVQSTTAHFFEINSINSSHVGKYKVRINNTHVPDLTIILAPNEIGEKYIELALQPLSIDNAGGAYHYNELIVKFEAGTSMAQKNAIMTFHGAIRLDACICNIERWYWDSLMIDHENKKEQIASEPEIESADFNYVVNSDEADIIPRDTTIFPHDTIIQQLGLNTLFDLFNPTALVAVIDAGIDHDHNALQDIFWTNEGETGNGEDSDGNCIKDDISGYDFIDDDAVPMDTTYSHGTHVTGLVQQHSDDRAKIISLRIFGNQTHSSLFAAVCATYYAADKGAKVINMSWGWYGEPADILRNAIAYAGMNCGALVVCSAGNNSLDIAAFSHYPSGYDLNNILVVASVDKCGSADTYQMSEYANTIDPTAICYEMAGYSNIGQGVDIVTPGTWESTIPNNEYANLSGTSMSAAVMSGIAAYLFAYSPDATWKMVKDCILTTAETPMYNDISGKVFYPIKHQDMALADMANRAVPSGCPRVIPLSPFPPFPPFPPFLGSFRLADEGLEKTNEPKTVSINPTPFRDEVQIGIYLEESCEAVMRIYNVSMQEIYKEKINMEKGSQKITWQGNTAPHGMYICHVEAGREIFVGKMVK